MSKRSRIVAAQAVVVTALVIIVIVTVLRPEGTNPLMSVEQPSQIQTTELPTPGSHPPHYNRGEDHRRNRPRERPNRDRGEQGAPVAAAPVPAATRTVAAPPVTTPAATEAGDEGSPADDQYSDTLTQLLNDLN